MKPKLMFWIDMGFYYFGLAKSLQEIFDCELFTIIECTDKPKKFFVEQKIVNFKKSWFYHDYIKDINQKPDLEYLKSIEKKYGINLWLIAFNDRMFNYMNEFYDFSTNQIFSILEQECKFFEKILNETKPDFMLMPPTHQQHNHIFYEMCRARGIHVLIGTLTRLGMRISLSDKMDPMYPLPPLSSFGKGKLIVDPIKYLETSNLSQVNKIFNNMFLSSKKKFGKAALNFLLTENSNLKTHYSYYGRNKIKVLDKRVSFELKSKRRESFMNKNLKNKVQTKLPFIYYPLHQEIERGLLLGAPFYSNQFENIKHIASSLPVGYKLIVKEHPNSKTRGWRSVTEMKKIMNLPNVIFLHPLANSNQIVDRSELVISIRGSSGIEAALRNKPSIVFGKVGMYKFSTINVVNSMTELPNTIKQALEQKVDRREIELYLKLVYENTFDFPKNEITNGFIETFAAGGYFANVEIDPNEMSLFIEKHKDELSFLAQKHIEIMKN